jgi:hypothetical protein
VSRISVEPSGLRSAGGVAQSAGADLRGLAGEILAALSAVGGAVPPETSAAAATFSGGMQTAALAIGDAVAALGSNAGTAADVYEQVDTQAMPIGPAAR